MTEFTIERHETVTVCLKLPRRIWDSWEYRHQHYGKAVHAARESLVELMAHRALAASPYEDKGDPFYQMVNRR